ncbi:MFS transporter [Gluconacetobacter sacchari]|uniref:MFS transporter n=1 Tax=Gluconacetobacter sacchari TaxID=92759 RepID=UPI0039B617FC
MIEGSSRRIRLAALAGNILEWYDFSVYALFSIPIASALLGGKNGYDALVGSWGVFAVAGLVRPLGGAILGRLADRRGRIYMLTATTLLMGVGSLMIVLCPTYAQAGLLSAIILIGARLIQGISAGGEFGGMSAFLSEEAHPGRRASQAAWLQMGMGMANLLGALVATVISFTLTPQQVIQGGWRLPFLFGLLIVPVGLTLRRTLVSRAPHARPLSGQGAPALKTSLWRIRKSLICAMGLSVGWAAAPYSLLIFMPSYLQSAFHIPASYTYSGAMVANVVLTAGCFLSGRIADRIGVSGMLVLAVASLFVTTVPILIWMTSHVTLINVAIGESLIALCVALFVGAAPAFIARLFPHDRRAWGIALSYNLVVPVCGNLAPAFLTYVMTAYGLRYAPGYYVMGVSVISLAAIVSARKIDFFRAGI